MEKGEIKKNLRAQYTFSKAFYSNKFEVREFGSLTLYCPHGFENDQLSQRQAKKL